MSRPIGMATPSVEELEAEIERLTKGVQYLESVIANHDAVNDKLETEVERLQVDSDKWREAYNSRTVEANRLRSALRQIAGGDHIPGWELMDIARAALTFQLAGKNKEIERLRDRNEVLEKSAEINQRIMDSYGARFDEYDAEIEWLRAALCSNAQRDEYRQSAVNAIEGFGQEREKTKRLLAALERIEVRGLEIISEHVGGSDASYGAQELTAIAREALDKLRECDVADKTDTA